MLASSSLLASMSHNFPLGKFMEQPYIDSMCQSVQPSWLCPQEAGRLTDLDGHETNRLTNEDFMNSSKCLQKTRVVWNGMT